MSLINDALKRAGKSQKPTSSSPTGEAPLQPVEGTADKKSLSLLLPFLGLVVLLLGGWFVWRWWGEQSKAPVQNATARPATTNRLVSALASASNVVGAISNRAASATAPTAASSATNIPAPPPVVVSQTTNVVKPLVPTNAPIVAQNTAASNAVSVVSPGSASAEAPKTNIAASAVEASATSSSNAALSRAGSFAPMTLQAVYFRLSKPSVLINNRTLYVGDEIEGARIVAIDRHSVKLEMAGKTKELTLK